MFIQNLSLHSFKLEVDDNLACLFIPLMLTKINAFNVERINVVLTPSLVTC